MGTTSSKPPKLKKCSCFIYQQGRTHCCKQQCLQESNHSTELRKLWIFTDAHVDALQESVTTLFLKYDLTPLVTIIERFLDGIHSTVEENTIYCHGSTDIETNEMQMMPCEVWLKTCVKNKHIQMEILGIKNVGKSAIALKCAKNMYQGDNNDEEIQQSAYIKRVTYADCNTVVKLRIFDHCLFEMDRMGNGIGTNRINNAINGYEFIYIMCVDPSSEDYFESFKAMQNYHYKLSVNENQSWNIDNLRHDAVNCAFIIVATKCDLKNQTYFRRSEDIILYCKNNNVPYIELSAKNNINMDKFLKICLYELWIQTQSHCTTL